MDTLQLLDALPPFAKIILGIVLTLFGLLGTLGIGNIITITIQRIFAKRDAQHQNAATIHASDLDASSEFRDALIKRIDILEKRLDDVNLLLTSQMKENARLSAENAALQKDNIRQEKEIAELRAECQNADIIIAQLRTEVDELKNRLDSK